MAEYQYENLNGSAKWDQPCLITIELHDLDHAHNLADAIKKYADKAAMGGDFSLGAVVNGESADSVFIGHDVSIQRVGLKVGIPETK